MKILDRLDAIGTGLFFFLKILILMLLFLAMVSGLVKIYTAQGGIVVLPFEISKTENLNSIAIADQLTAELMRIQQIHNIKNDEVILRKNSMYAKRKIFPEQLLGNQKMIVPKAEIEEFSMANLGTINLGSGSIDPGKLIIAFKSILPFSKPVTIIRGSLQGYGSNIVLIVLLEGNNNVQSWMIRQTIDDKNEEQLDEMIGNAAFMIVHDLPQSNVSAKTWEGLKYYTKALEAYHQYDLSRNLDDLSLAGNFSLKAISSEKGYEKPVELLGLLEMIYSMIGMQKEAIEYCNATIKSAPTSAYAWNNKGDLLNVEGNYDGAIHAFEMVIKLDPQSASAWNSKGLALVRKGEVNSYGLVEVYAARAVEAFDEAIKLDPQSASAWNNKAYALVRQGNYDGAVEAFDEVIKLDPQSASAWNSKGSVLEKLGRTADANAAYAKARKLVLGSKVINGKVKFFNTIKGFGFIASDDGRDFFVDETGLKPGVTIDVGDKVSFEVIEGEKGLKADKVELTWQI